MKEKIRLSGLIHESLVNGPGIRRVFFSQGCNHKCKGCFNPDTHNLSGGEEFIMDELIDDAIRNPIITGVTFSGGDPMEQADKFSYMAKSFKKAKLNIWCYTGYTFEYILKNRNNRAGWSELINNVDVLIDGKFEEDKKKSGLRFRGSSNQRIINVKKSLETGQIVILDY